jgi:hypothetical protein
MTDYCSITDIEAWFPGVVFTSETKITRTRVEALISRHSATIDSRLHTVYEVPITGTTAAKIVKEICEFLTIADVEDVLNKGIGRRAENITPVNYRQLANTKLDKLETGEITLTDATAKRSYEFHNENESSSIDPKFKRDTTQW